MMVLGPVHGHGDGYVTGIVPGLGSTVDRPSPIVITCLKTCSHGTTAIVIYLFELLGCMEINVSFHIV